MSEFREMRRKRQQLSEEESIGILQKATAGTLALLGDDDYPYAVPISYVYHEGQLYFHSALAGHKVDAIRKCDKASFCVIEQDDVQPKKYTTFFRSVIAFGRIHIIEGKQEKLEAARMLGNRYNPSDNMHHLTNIKDIEQAIADNRLCLQYNINRYNELIIR